MFIPSMVMFSVLAVINHTAYSRRIKQLFTEGLLKHSSLIVAVITFVLGIWLKEITLVILAIFLSIRKLDDMNIIILSTQLTILGEIFVSPNFNKYGLILSLAYVIRNFKKTNAKKTNYWYLVAAVILIMYFILVQQNAISYLLIIQLILFFILVEYKAIFALLFILISTAISVIFFNNQAQNYFLLAYATFKTFKNYQPDFKVELKPVFINIILLAATLITSPIHSAYLDKVKQQYHRFNTEYLNTNQEQNTGNEGRRRNYIENTLAEKYTRAELLATGFASIASILLLYHFIEFSIR
jgi:hypothetical protein